MKRVGKYDKVRCSKCDKLFTARGIKKHQEHCVSMQRKKEAKKLESKKKVSE